MLADYHVHSHFSPDSKYDMEEVVKDAIDLHIDELCFTDHIDFGMFKCWDYSLSLDERKKLDSSLYMSDYVEDMASIERLKDKYSDKIVIKKGFEFGIQTSYVNDFKALYDSYDLDFVILSVHGIDNHPLWSNDYQGGKTQKEYNLRYYQEIYDDMKLYKDYCVLGHLDSIARYDRKGIFPFEEIEEVVAEILKLAIKENKGIEINTSNIRYGLKDSTPSKEILMLYHDLGGKIITTGSDSHSKGQLAIGFKDAKQYLASLGFKYFCTYDKMQPIYHDLLGE